MSTTLDETAIANAMDLLSCSVSNPVELKNYAREQYGDDVVAEANRRLDQE